MSPSSSERGTETSSSSVRLQRPGEQAIDTSPPSARPRQLSAAEFQAKTAVSAAASAQMSGQGGQHTMGRQRSSTLVATGTVGQAGAAADRQHEQSANLQQAGPTNAAAGPSTLRHPTGNVARIPALDQIKEAIYEPESPRYKRSRLQQASLLAEPVEELRESSRDRSRTMPSEALTRALPRGYDPATERVREDRSSRPGLPFIFSDDRGTSHMPPSVLATPSSEFPNPHTPIMERGDSEMAPAQQRHRRAGDATLPSQMRAQAQSQEIPPTPPLASPAAPFGTRDRVHPADRVQQATYRTQPVVAQQEFEWSSDGSSPTPTASSITAELAKKEKTKVELIPIQLIHPSSYAAKPAWSPALAPTLSQTRAESSAVPTQRVFLAPKKQMVAGPSTGGRVDTRDVVVQAGKEVPLVRTDLRNLKRIPAAAVKQGSSSTNLEGVRSANAAVAQQTAGPSRDVAVVAGPRAMQTTESTFGRLPHAPPAAAVTSNSERGASAKLLSVRGHVLGTSKATLLARKDGSARPIYSPTPLTVAAVKDQEQAKRGEAEQLSPSAMLKALPAPTVAPSAPQLPHQIRFRRKFNIASPEPTPPQTGARSPPLGAGGSRRIDDSRRATVGLVNPEDAPVAGLPLLGGSVDPALLKETNRKPFLYQQQQNEEKSRSVRQAIPASLGARPEVTIRIESATDDGSKDAGDSSQRCSSYRRDSIRRDSIGSASTAFDADEAVPGMQKTLSGRQAEKRRSVSHEGKPASFDVERKMVAGGLVAPPSDVPEGKEPSDGRSNGSQHTESYTGARQRQLIIETPNNRASGSRGDRSEFRFVPILNVNPGARAARPRTGNTRVFFRFGHSREGRTHNAPACRQCFRAGFDCAMNLHLGEVTTGRKAFQDFVAAGGLNALSIRDGARQEADGSIYEQSITVGDALGRNYVDKLGEVAFGESALSRPVTRGMINNLVEEQQKRDTHGQFLADHKPWSADEKLEDAADDLEKDVQDAAARMQQQERRLSQATLRNEPATVIARNLDMAGEQQFKADIIDPADFDRLSEGTASDDLDSIADRWPLWRKIAQMVVLGVYVFALQALDSGYTEAILRIIADFQPTPLWTRFVGLGMLCFNGSQAGGLLLGCLFVSFGRQRILLVTLVLVGAVCVIAGFARAVVVTLVLQYLLGQLAGIVLFLTAAMLVDIFVTYTTRLVGLMMLVFAVAIGQLSGPWIARLILAHTSWLWQYWAMLAFAGAMVVVVGVCAKETNPSVLFRRHVQSLRQKQGLWTPDPQLESSWSQVLREDGLRPFRVLHSSWTIPLLALSTTFFLGVFVFMYAGINRVFVEIHSLSATMGALASTVSGVIGVFWAIFALFVIDSRINSELELRTLDIDEKGYIDAAKAERNTERVLIGAMFGAGLFSLSLYTIAITSQMGLAWLFTSFGVVMHTAGIIIIVVSSLQYTLDSFTPARPVKIQDVTAREEPSSPPVSRLAAGEVTTERAEDSYTVAPRSLVRRNSDDTVSTLTKRDKRWGNETALAAFAVVVALSVTIANVLYIPSTVPSNTISFQAFAVIFASASLLVIAAPVLLYMYGGRSRLAAVAKLDHNEAVRAYRRLQKGRSDSGDAEEGRQRPQVMSARASRVVPWISKCLSGDTVISASEPDATRVRARAQAQARGYIVSTTPPLAGSPTGSTIERSRREELYLGRILADRAAQEERSTSPHMRTFARRRSTCTSPLVGP